MIIPVSAVIVTSDRAKVLRHTLISVLRQSHVPAEFIIIDASSDDNGKIAAEDVLRDIVGAQLIYCKATKKGAAVQRMEGISSSTYSFIWFLDDDIILEEGCIKKLWEGINLRNNVGAVNAMISNQKYTSPGRLTRIMYRLMYGATLGSYAGKIIGPAWNLLPEDKPGLPEYIRCEWLNTTCTLYRKDALPDPVFSDFFYGYSMFEDVTLSAIMARKFELLNARTARIFHDSQPGVHKSNVVELAKMSLVNRHYVMTAVLHRTQFSYYLKLFTLEMFGLISGFRTPSGFVNFPKIIWGKTLAVVQIFSNK